jgi:hypothetical protein
MKGYDQGHVAYIDKTNAYKILIVKPLGNRKHTGSDDVKMDGYFRLWK